MNLKVIAYARNGHTDKFGIPRQSRDESPILTRIVFEPEYSVQEALRGIEGYSHLWLLWGFSKQHLTSIQPAQDLHESRESYQITEDWSPTVRPPRLGGNKRVGVFATRSPYRPNPIGLSSVRLVDIQHSVRSNLHQFELLVSGADVLDGTPIYDIKPYLSFSDSHPDAKNGFADETKDYRLEVDWGEFTLDYLSKTDRERTENGPRTDRKWVEEVTYILSQDPRPAYQDDPNREYKLDYGGITVTFVVKDGTVFVKNLEKM